MILESAQMLCTVLNKMGYTTPYRSTHAKHPCVLWLAESYDNFRWLEALASELNREFRIRYGRARDHASFDVIRQLKSYRYAANGMTPFAQAMPNHYKVPGDAVAAYRAFYIGEKLDFATWTNRAEPKWIKQEKLQAP